MPYISKNTISATVLERVKKTPDLLGFQRKVEKNWEKISFQSFFRESEKIALGLKRLGLQAAEKVAILSSTRVEWALTDLGILGCRAVSVPIYPSSLADEVAYVLLDSQSKIIFVEDAKQLSKILDQREKLKCIEHIVVFDSLALRHHPARKDVLSFEALTQLGAQEKNNAPSFFEQSLLDAQPTDLMSICYTSGTTGVPKGVMISHQNLMSVLTDALARVSLHIEADQEVLVTFLPFSHIIGKVESLTGWVFGWSLAFSESYESLIPNIAEIKPTVLFAVPRVFEKAMQRIESSIEISGKIKKSLCKKAFVECRKEYFAHVNRLPLSIQDTATVYLLRKTVLAPIIEKFGGRLKFVICGGAPLLPEVGEFFYALGIKILEGYGLTETCAPVTLNTPNAIKFGTVGKPLPEVVIRIDEDQEILIKSDKVFMGYYNKAEETQAAFLVEGSERWFRTGDIGFIDDDGFLVISDRKKDLIITSGGKNIAPQKIENLAKNYSLIHQILVYGEQRHYLVALLTLDAEKVKKYAEEQGILYSSYSELIKNSRIIALVQSSIDALNAQLASYETIKKFIILPRDFTVESGEMTPSLKLKRAAISKKFKTDLDRLYGV